MPAEQWLLGENWSRDIELPSREDTPQQDGLLAALNLRRARPFSSHRNRG